MARSPRRWNTVKVDGVPNHRLPHCGGCDELMSSAYLCEPCQEVHGPQHKNYALVPMRDDQSLREALVAMLESLPRD